MSAPDRPDLTGLARQLRGAYFKTYAGTHKCEDGAAWLRVVERAKEILLPYGEPCAHCGFPIVWNRGEWWHIPTHPDEKPAMWCRTGSFKAKGEPAKDDPLQTCQGRDESRAAIREFLTARPKATR